MSRSVIPANEFTVTPSVGDIVEDWRYGSPRIGEQARIVDFDLETEEVTIEYLLPEECVGRMYVTGDIK